MATPKDQALNGIVVGLKALTGEVKPRVDIDVLLTQHPDTFNLMLQALTLMQKDPKTLGFYALAGIHGLPSAAWDDVYNDFDQRFGGYCAHGVLTFPTWHRPYLSLFEQTVYLKMVDIANTYNSPHRERYVAACKEFRLPYFDYFRPRGGKVEFPGVVRGTKTSFPYDFRLPDIFNTKKVTILKAPNNDPDADFDNPLYTYKFSEANGQLPQRDRDSIQNLYSLKQTVRRPTSRQSDTHDTQALSDAINSGRQSRTTMMIKLLNSTPYQELRTVASDRLQDGDLTFTKDVSDPNGPDGMGSLGGTLHGNYHVLIGGRGVMGDPAVAAFDPIFWFHHCNIDRYWAIWAAMHPKSWFPKPRSPSEKPENQKDLLPFYKTRSAAGKGTYHNSDDAKTTEAYGYFYDDFDGPAEQLWKRFTTKYEWSTKTVQDPNIVKPPANMAPLDREIQASQFFQKNPKPANPVAKVAKFATSSMEAAAAPIMMQAQAVMEEVAPAALQTTGPKISPTFNREWYIDSKVLRSASNGSFTIFFFLAKPGELDEDTTTFMVSPFLAGFNHIFTAPREQCDNCGNLEAAGQLATDTSLITPLLLDYLNLPDNGLESLQPERVKPFLIKYLRWRVVYRDNSLHDPRHVPDLKVGVTAEYYQEDGSKTYEDHQDIVDTILQNASNSPTATT